MFNISTPHSKGKSIQWFKNMKKKTFLQYLQKQSKVFVFVRPQPPAAPTEKGFLTR